MAVEVEWRRRGQWHAHAWIDGRCLCKSDGSSGVKHPHGEAKLAPLSSYGVPFGRVCQVCMRRAVGAKRVAARPDETKEKP